MCEPTTILFASMALTAGGGIMSANAQNQAGKQQQAYYDYVSSQNKMQADAAKKAGEQQSAISQDSGALQAERAQKEGGKFMASQKAAMAANGILGSVTSADILQDTMGKQSLDDQTIRLNADTRSWQAKTSADYQAWDLMNQSSLNTMAGINARRAAAASANATLLSTAGSVAGSYANYNLASMRTKQYGQSGMYADSARMPAGSSLF